MIRNNKSLPARPESQIEVDRHVLGLLGGMTIATADDLVALKDRIRSALVFRPYNDQSKEHADSIQWRRTASEIIQDGYVYEGKACSDLAIVYLALCKAAGLDGLLVKLNTLDNARSHSIVEVDLRGTWFRLDPSSPDSVPFEGQLTAEAVWNKNWLGGWKVYKKGRDLWDLGLTGIESEGKLKSV